jgi:hypothetical protein
LGLELILAIYLVRSGRAVVIAAMVVVLVVTAALLILERIIVTDAEAVEDTLYAAAGALEANDPPQVLALFSTASPHRGEVQSILSHVTVREARIGDLEIHFGEGARPSTATATFIGRVQARDDRGQIPYEQMIRRLRVTLRREADRWLIYDYADVDTRGTGTAKPASLPGVPRQGK